MAKLFLGNTAPVGLGILVALACFTTATGIVTGTADFVASYFEGPAYAPGTARKVFISVAIAGAILGVLMGQFPRSLYYCHSRTRLGFYLPPPPLFLWPCTSCPPPGPPQKPLRQLSWCVL